MARRSWREEVSMRCAAVACLLGLVLTVVIIEKMGWGRALVGLLAWPVLIALYLVLKAVFVPREDV